MAYKIKDKDGLAVVVKNQQALGLDHFGAEIKDFNNAERSFLAVANAESEDRYKDIIMVDGWGLKNFKKNPVVMPFHDYRSLPVGRALDVFADEKKKVKRLMFIPQFAAYPDTIRMYEMYRDKYLKGFSVGFLEEKSEPIKGDDDKENEGSFFFHTPTRYLKQELLEVSAVPIPAHQDALAEIKAMVKKGSLYIPARHLRKEEDPEIEVIGEFVHIMVADPGEFDTSLYVKEFEHVTAVFGKIDDELFPCKWIMGSDYCCPDVALEWTEEISETLFKAIEEEQKGQDPPALRIYDPEKYESKDIVVVNVPTLNEIKFDPQDVKDEDDDDEIELDADGEVIDKDEDEATVTREMIEALNAMLKTLPFTLAGFEGRIKGLETKIEDIYTFVVNEGEEESTDDDTETGTLDEDEDETLDLDEDGLEDEDTEVLEVEETDDEAEVELEGVDENDFKKMVGDAVKGSLGQLD